MTGSIFLIAILCMGVGYLIGAKTNNTLKQQILDLYREKEKYRQKLNQCEKKKTD